MDFAALADAAAARAPQAPVEGVVPGRTLVIDGDGLAYYCAGNDDTTKDEARNSLNSKIAQAKAACGAEHVVLAVTGRGSHKGHRYAIARVKPYQGQRSNARRPRNWEFLRELLEAHPLTRVVLDREADDVIGEVSGAVSAKRPAAVVLTQDKDMRMLTGCWHMDWATHGLLFVDSGTYELVHNDKVYGSKWFLLQLLQGDTADNIPGLPFYCDGSFYAKGHFGQGQLRKLRIGEKGAQEALAKTTNFSEGLFVVRQLYLSYYGARADVELAEQAVLLWMRKGADAHWSEGPEAVGCSDAAIDELFNRVQEARGAHDFG